MQTKSSLVAITGNTFVVKEQLKALGARWNADKKAWMISMEKAGEAQKIVAGAGPAKPRTFGARSNYARARCSCSCHRGGGRACRSCNFDGCEQADGPEDN